MSFREVDQTVEEAAKPAEPMLPWYVAYTRPRMEETALLNLQRQGFHAYLPMFKTVRQSDDGLQPTHVAMFPRYVFLRPATTRQSLSTVASTRGVSALVRFGVEPAIVLPEIIRHIREFEIARNRAGLDTISPIQPGVRVRMRKGALKSLEGLVVSVAKQRVTFLLEILGRQKPVTVAHDELESA